MADPQGGLLPFGGVDLSTGPSTCTSEDTLGGFVTPLGALLLDSKFGLCPGGADRIEWIGADLTFGFAGNPQLIRARLCDVCPVEL